MAVNQAITGAELIRMALYHVKKNYSTVLLFAFRSPLLPLTMEEGEEGTDEYKIIP